jgi:reverse gyrase
MRESMPLLVFQQEVLAEFIASAGQVFRWSPEAITSALAKPKGHVVVGVDLAKKVDFTVFYATPTTGCRAATTAMNEVAWPMQRNRLQAS